MLHLHNSTNGNPWAPDTPTLGSISRAAFELDDYLRIVEILHKRFLRFDRRNRRTSYNSPIVLEYLLPHGPESGAQEFQSDRDVIREMGSFQYIDEKGFNWGLAVRKKSEKILKLLENGILLKEERDRSRKLTRGIQGFGSFCQRSSSAQGSYGMFNSPFRNQENQNGQILSSNEGALKGKTGRLQQSQINKMEKNSSFWISFSDAQKLTNPEASFKENMAPKMEELDTLLGGKKENGKDESRIGSSREEDDHPFNETQNYTTASLLSAREEILQGS